MKDKLLTVSEVATMYDVSVGTVNYWITQGAPVSGERQLRGRYPTRLLDKNKLQKWLDERHRRVPARKI